MRHFENGATSTSHPAKQRRLDDEPESTPCEVQKPKNPPMKSKHQRILLMKSKYHRILLYSQEKEIHAEVIPPLQYAQAYYSFDEVLAKLNEDSGFQASKVMVSVVFSIYRTLP